MSLMERMTSTIYRKDTQKGKCLDRRIVQAEMNNEGRNTLEGMNCCAFRAEV